MLGNGDSVQFLVSEITKNVPKREPNDFHNQAMT